jgi:hypothetical protein
LIITIRQDLWWKKRTPAITPPPFAEGIAAMLGNAPGCGVEPRIISYTSDESVFNATGMAIPAGTTQRLAHLNESGFEM